MKRSLILMLGLLGMMFIPLDNYPWILMPSPYKIKTIVIDAGHGGKDPGAIGFNKSQEKDIVLKVSLMLGRYIQQAFPEIKVVYTRDKDEFIELHERASIANRNKADLFISIHCNAHKSTEIDGTEVYVLGLHKTDDNLSVAKRENAVILLEDNYLERYDGFDPNSPESHIIFSLFQSAFQQQSISYATKADQQFKERVQRKSRGVKQAGFMVLYRTTMPGVLVELGFISNQKEEAYLRSAQGQDYMASALFRAFREYKEEMEAGGGQLSEGDLVKPQPKETPVETPKSNASSTIFFKVQFMSLPVEVQKGDSRLKGITAFEIERYQEKTYRYTTPQVLDYQEAVRLQQKIRNQGFSDAFVVAYQNGLRIPLQTALQSLRKE